MLDGVVVAAQAVERSLLNSRRWRWVGAARLLACLGAAGDAGTGKGPSRCSAAAPDRYPADGWRAGFPAVVNHGQSKHCEAMNKCGRAQAGVFEGRRRSNRASDLAGGRDPPAPAPKRGRRGPLPAVERSTRRHPCRCPQLSDGTRNRERPEKRESVIPAPPVSIRPVGQTPSGPGDSRTTQGRVRRVRRSPRLRRRRQTAARAKNPVRQTSSWTRWQGQKKNRLSQILSRFWVMENHKRETAQPFRPLL